MMFIIILKGADILISCALENKLLLINTVIMQFTRTCEAICIFTLKWCNICGVQM